MRRGKRRRRMKIRRQEKKRKRKRGQGIGEQPLPMLPSWLWGQHDRVCLQGFSTHLCSGN